ncbi:MAG: tail fiber domain-containing protein [Bacteroidota bacterium]
MKRHFLFIAIVTIIVIMSDVQIVEAQQGMDYNNTSLLTFRFSRLRNFGGSNQNKNNQNEKAIGLYTEDLQPQSALDINTDFTHMPNYLFLWYNRGEVFRTDCPAGTISVPVTTNWRMLRGGLAIARFYNTTGSNDFFMEAQQSGASLRFNTTSFFGSSTKMIITDGLLGFVGIGNNFLFPQSQLHINDGAFSTYTQITNAATGATATDGFRIGVAAITGIAELRQQEYSDMKFYTNSINYPDERMIIDKDGFVGINEVPTAPGSVTEARLTIEGPIRQVLTTPTTFETLWFVHTTNNTNPLGFMGDGFRMKYDRNFFGLSNEAVIFERTDYNNLDPDGGIAFTNTGYDNIEVTAMAIKGTGNIGIGSIFGSPGAVLPTAMLDIDGRVRVRVLGTPPSTYEIVVADNTATDYGHLFSIPVSSLNLGGFGAACSLYPVTQYNLSEDWRVGLDNNNLYFDGQGGPTYTVPGFPNSGFYKNNVGIGHTCTEPYLMGKFSVLQTAPSIRLQVGQFTLYQSYAGYFDNNITTSSPNVDYAYAIYSIAQGVNSDINYGVAGIAKNGLYSNIGIYGYAPIGTLNYAGCFDGDVYTTGGTNSLAGYISGSDRKIKTDTTMFFSGLNVIRNIHPISYRLNGKAGSDSTRTNIGVFAEDMVSIAPYAVDTFYSKLDSTDTEPTLLLGIKNEAIMYTAVNAIKELDSIVTGITSPPSKPVLISPTDEATEVSVSAEFNWHKQNNVTFYRIIFSTTADSSGLYQTYDCTDTVAIPGGFACGTTYFWWVIAYNSYGFSEPSEIWSFTTLVPPLPPMLAYPANGDTIRDNFVTFSWFPSEGSDNYYLYIRATSIPSPYAGKRNIVYPIIIVTDTFYSLEVTPDMLYTWNVSACAELGCCGYSDSWSFTTLSGFEILKGQSVAELSDSQLKTNIAPLNGSLTMLMQLNGIYFEWDSLQYPSVYFEQGRQIGLTAQDVQPVIPEVVKTDAQGYSYIEYNRLIPVLIESIKEQQSTIDTLQNQLATVLSLFGANAKITGDNGNNNNQSNMQYVELVTENAIILNQNDPNPFAEETNITYFLSDDVSEAKILFYDNTGKIIKTVELIGRGDGALHVYASNLSAGIYTYALVADGKVTDTKKMVCAKK